MGTNKPARQAPVRRKAVTSNNTDEPTITARMKELRLAAKLTQEAIGAQGVISMPGWIKIENGQRNPSEKMLEKFVALMAAEGVIHANQAAALLDELAALKYSQHRSDFLRRITRERLKTIPPVAIQAVPER